MTRVIPAIRTALFYLVFIGQTAILAIIIGIIGLIAGPTRFTWALARYWCWSNVQFLRVIAGLDTRISGDEHIPPGGCIIASEQRSGVVTAPDQHLGLSFHGKRLLVRGGQRSALCVAKPCAGWVVADGRHGT